MQVATLGQIEINGAGRVAQVFGQGAPPPDGMFTEPELTKLSQVLYNLNDLNDLRRGYNPRLIIRAVNVLWPLGKEKALAAVAEYVRVSNEDTDFHAWESLILVLRTLFEVPTVPTTFIRRRGRQTETSGSHASLIFCGRSRPSPNTCPVFRS